MTKKHWLSPHKQSLSCLIAYFMPSCEAATVVFELPVNALIFDQHKRSCAYVFRKMYVASRNTGQFICGDAFTIVIDHT